MGNNKLRYSWNILFLITLLCLFMIHAAPSVYAQFFPADPAFGGFGFGGFGFGGFGAPFSGFYGPQQGAGFFAPQFGLQGGLPYQGPGLNPGYAPSGFAAFPNVPYVPLSSNSSDSSNSDTRTYQSYNQGYNTGINMGYNTGFNTGYNPGFLPGGVPTTGVFGPAAGMYGPQAALQPYGYSGIAPAAAAGFTPYGQAAGFAPYGQAAGVMNPFMGGMMNPLGMQTGPFMQPMQMGPFGPMGFNPYAQNFFRQQQGFFNPWNPYGMNPNYNPNFYPNTGSNNDDDDSGTDVTDDIPDIRGYWSGTWKILETEIDPNGMEIIVEKEAGDILFQITSQIQTGGPLNGKVEITEWDVEDFPDWVGEEDKIALSGWVDKYNRWLFAHYFNFTGDELLSDLSNLICDYTWTFDNLRIKDNGFSGNFRIKGTNNYDVVGTFNVGKYQPTQ